MKYRSPQSPAWEGGSDRRKEEVPTSAGDTFEPRNSPQARKLLDVGGGGAGRATKGSELPGAVPSLFS